MDFFDDNDYEKLAQMDSTVDELRERFGKDSVKRASFVADKKTKTVDHMSGGISREKELLIWYNCN